jgi:hypothetical protein
MIRTVEACPICNAVIGIDDRNAAIVFNPDRADPEPCPHLTCFWMMLSVHTGGRTQAFDWVWEYGKGLRAGKDDPMPIEDRQIGDYLLLYPDFDDDTQYLIPKAAHFVVGASAGAREDKKLGSGEFLVVRGNGLVAGLLDGWAIFAPQPAKVMKEIQQFRHRIPPF